MAQPHALKTGDLVCERDDSTLDPGELGIVIDLADDGVSVLSMERAGSVNFSAGWDPAWLAPVDEAADPDRARELRDLAPDYTD